MCEGIILIKVDIIMATYNGEKYISGQIMSIINQTYTNYRLLICDDNSSDNTLNIIEQYARNDSRITVYKNINNLGYNTNFMNLIKKTESDYIAIADQDDIWHENQLELLVKAMLNNNVDLVFGKSAYINENNEKINYRTYVKPFKITKSYELFDDNIIPGRNMLFSKNLKDKIFPIPNLSRNFIYDWYIALIALENRGVLFINKEINLYRVHTNSATNDSSIQKLCSQKDNNLNIIIDSLRFRALENRLLRIKEYEKFIRDKKQLDKYQKYINSLYKTKYINFNFISFYKYMKIRTFFYKMAFFLILHFPIFYKVLDEKKLRKILSKYVN